MDQQMYSLCYEISEATSLKNMYLNMRLVEQVKIQSHKHSYRGWDKLGHNCGCRCLSETRNIQVLRFGATYIRGLMVNCEKCFQRICFGYQWSGMMFNKSNISKGIICPTTSICDISSRSKVFHTTVHIFNFCNILSNQLFIFFSPNIMPFYVDWYYIDIVKEKQSSFWKHNFFSNKCPHKFLNSCATLLRK